MVKTIACIGGVLASILFMAYVAWTFYRADKRMELLQDEALLNMTRQGMD